MRALLARFLILCLLAAPFHARAGLVASDEAAAAPGAQAARSAIAGLLQRSDVASRLQSLGVSPQAALERVAALSDAEVSRLAGQIDQAPAGGSAALAALLVIGILAWWLVNR